jgi:hypothetical protein
VQGQGGREGALVVPEGDVAHEELDGTPLGCWCYVCVFADAKEVEPGYCAEVVDGLIPWVVVRACYVEVLDCYEREGEFVLGGRVASSVVFDLSLEGKVQAPLFVCHGVRLAVQ